MQHRRFPICHLPLAASLLLAPAAACADDVARVNGRAITTEEYIQALERAPVAVGSGGATIDAGRFVLDQLVGKKVVEAEAARRGLAPSDADIQKRFDTQRRLLEQQMPGQSLEAAMKAQGTSEKRIKDDMRYQMAETNLLAAELNVTEDDLKKAYEQFKGQMGVPERAQLRIVAPENAEALAQAQKQLSAKTEFSQVAKQFNPASLRASGGLLPQPVAVTQMPPAVGAKVQKSEPATVFGPVEWPTAPGQPASKVWIRIEKKFAGVPIPYEEAKPLVKQQLVQAALADPKNDAVRRRFTQLKQSAKFESGDPRYQVLWDSLKKAAAANTAASGPATAGAATGSKPAANK